MYHLLGRSSSRVGGEGGVSDAMRGQTPWRHSIQSSLLPIPTLYWNVNVRLYAVSTQCSYLISNFMFKLPFGP